MSESVIIKSYFYSQNPCFIRTKFCPKESTRLIQTIYLACDKNNFQINLQTKNQKIICTKNCLKESTRIIQTIHLMSDKNNFQINLIAKILKIIQVKFYLNESTIIIQWIYLMSVTNNFRINLLTKNPIVYLCEILSEQDNKNRSEFLLDKWQNQFTNKCTHENLEKLFAWKFINTY